MKIHFVCTGNIYRSRLAEVYLKSKQIPNLSVSSSGTKASAQLKGPITWYAQRILQRNILTSFMSYSWKNTEYQTLKNYDYIIFMSIDNYNICKSKNYPMGNKYEIWDIPDFDNVNLNGKKLNKEAEIELIENSEKTFSKIKNKVDQLIKKIQSSNKK